MKSAIKENKEFHAKLIKVILPKYTFLDAGIGPNESLMIGSRYYKIYSIDRSTNTLILVRIAKSDYLDRRELSKI